MEKLFNTETYRGEVSKKGEVKRHLTTEEGLERFLKEEKLPTNCFKCGILLYRANLHKHQERCNFTPSEKVSR